jgi:hypothetical protein
MLKINIDNLVMLIVTMVKFIMRKPTMAQLIMVKLIIMVKLTNVEPTIVKLTTVKLFINPKLLMAKKA